jgi:formylglycine-generating enzyme required for sulfatase activity
VRHHSFPNGLTRFQLMAKYRAIRARTAQVFAIPREEAYYERPIALRNPIVFYEGHLPAFAVNTLVKLTLGEPGIDARYEELFARGIDPEDEAAAKSPTDLWPSREEVLAYGREADALIERTLCDGDLARDDYQAALAILEHEQMHQETLMYMFHELEEGKKRSVIQSREDGEGSQSRGRRSLASLGRTADAALAHIPPGPATLGTPAGDFGWDNEFPPLQVDVPAFSIDVHKVTNGQYLDYVLATGAAPSHFWARRDGEWLWRGMFGLEPLPLDAPVYVMHDEAAAYAAWRGMRLPTEAEYHRAAFGTPEGIERAHPWGDAPPDATHGNFGFAHTDPVPVGSYPDGASAWGVHDLVGNGWEWTSTVFDGFPGFQPMACYPGYSADFFDGKHYVMKGASPATAPELIRSGFRNWFRPNYPYAYAAFRCVR